MGIEEAEELKKKGNGHFQKGEWKEAVDTYTESLKYVDSASTTGAMLLRCTLLSNRAACLLKQRRQSSDETTTALESCIEDCSQALDFLQKAPSARDDRDQQQQRQKLLGKLLYRRASARSLLVASLPQSEEHLQNRQRHLRNEAARDLLQLLSFDPNNADASRLFKEIRQEHDATTTSGINGVLTTLRETSLSASENLATSLFQLLSLVTDDLSSASMELGRCHGVTTMMQILTYAGKWADAHSVPSFGKCRLVALQVLSAASSHGPFVRAFLSPSQLSQQSLAKVALEAEPELAVAAMGLMMRIVLFLDHNDNAEPILENNNVQLIDGPSICRMCVGALRTPQPETRPARAAIELLSAWTASDMDSVASAAAATAEAYREEDSSTSGRRRRARRIVKSDEEVRRLQPRDLALHRKKEYELQQAQRTASRTRIQLFCDVQTGGLSALLECAVTTSDRTLRREVASAVARWVSSAFDFYGDDSQKKEDAPQLEENAKLKKIFGDTLGWNGVTKSSKQGTTLTIVELDDEDEDDDDDEERKGNEKDGEDKELLEKLKRAHLTTAMLLGNAEAGAWALATGWSNGSGVSELRSLVALRHNDTALSLASDVISAASASEKARSSLAPLVEGGDLQLLLASSDRSIRSAAASAMTKLGLANKEISNDEGEMVGLLQVAAELVMHDDDDDDEEEAKNQNDKDKENGMSTALSESIDRGIEVLSYLASRTPVKEEIAHGFKPSPQSPLTVLERLVELACRPGSGEKVSAYGLASIFEVTAVSIQTLRNESLADKGISAEDYDQLQSLAKTKEEKESEETNRAKEADPSEAVAARVVALSQARVPRALFKLSEGSSSEAAQGKIAGAMNRMAVETTVRGAMIQQGCLSACLKLEKKGDRSKEEKAITLKARHCMGKLLATTNPNVLTASQRLGSIRPLLQLVRDHDSSDLAKFEALLSLTNLASVGDDAKDRIMAENGMSILRFAMFSDHEMVRRAATETLSNLVPHTEMMKHLADPDQLRMWVAFAMDFDQNFECARAAAGCLAMALFDRDVANALVELKSFRDFVVALLECGNLELMHRILVVLLTLLDHHDGGSSVPIFLEAVVETSGPQFCLAYVQSYHDGKKADDLEMTASDRETMRTTVELAKEVARRCF